MSRHTVTLDEIKDYEIIHELAGQVGQGHNKHLLVVVKGKTVFYQVISHKKSVAIETVLERAVWVYNGIA